MVHVAAKSLEERGRFGGVVGGDAAIVERNVKRRTWFIFIAFLLFTGLGAWLWLGQLEQSYQQPPYSLIEDGLYLGSSVREPPPGTQAVVNLCGREDPYTVEARLWEPILEGGEQEPDLPWLKRVVAFIAEQRAAGRITYIHCMNGVNRSAMVTIAYLMHERELSRDGALAYVRSKRPVIQPGTDLMRLLAEWEETLLQSRQGTRP